MLKTNLLIYYIVMRLKYKGIHSPNIQSHEISEKCFHPNVFRKQIFNEYQLALFYAFPSIRFTYNIANRFH